MNTAFNNGDGRRHFHDVLSHAPISAVLIDANGQFLTANKAFRDLVGAPSEEAILSQTICDAGVCETDQVRAVISELRHSSDTEANFEAQWTSNWGKPVVARVFATKVLDENGALFFQVFYEDLSIGPAESDNRLWNSMLDTSTNQFHVIDGDSLKFLFVSQRAIKEFGYSMPEFLTMTAADICPVSTLDDIRSTFLKPLINGTTNRVNGKASYRRKNGSTYSVDVNVQKTLFKGSPAYLVIAQDVSEAIATNAALAQAELFLSSAPDPTVIVNGSGVVVFASDRTEALLGYSRNELVGMALERFWPLSTDQFVTSSESATVNPVVPSAIKELIHRDGSCIPVETTLSRIETTDGRLTAISCRNVTNRLAIEAALKSAKQTAEHAMITKTHLLAAASHDLRQPTQSLSHYSWLMRQAATTPEQIDLATNIQTSVDSIANLLNAFLDISKLDSGVTRPKIVEYDVQSLCPSIVANFGPAAQAAGIELICDCKSFYVRSDPVLVQRVIENLVSNAIRNTRHGTVSVTSKSTETGLMITVSDTGIGIANNQIERIFDEHYQIASANSSEAKGLGLGLSIVQRITKLLDLPVTVQSQLGRGSQFSITLEPVTDQTTQPATTSYASSLADRVRAPEVLLIDDELAVLNSTKMVLERHQCTVYTAATAETAMEQLQAGIKPDILITDYRLPGNSGTELVESARQALGRNIPAVIITGDMSGDAFKIDHLPSIKVLHKPTNLKRLVSTIAELTR